MLNQKQANALFNEAVLGAATVESLVTEASKKREAFSKVILKLAKGCDNAAQFQAFYDGYQTYLMLPEGQAWLKSSGLKLEMTEATKSRPSRVKLPAAVVQACSDVLAGFALSDAGTLKDTSNKPRKLTDAASVSELRAWKTHTKQTTTDEALEAAAAQGPDATVKLPGKGVVNAREETMRRDCHSFMTDIATGIRGLEGSRLEGLYQSLSEVAAQARKAVTEQANEKLEEQRRVQAEADAEAKALRDANPIPAPTAEPEEAQAVHAAQG